MRFLINCHVVFCLVLVSSLAWSEEPNESNDAGGFSIEGDKLVAQTTEGETEIELPGPALSMMRVDALVYVAMGEMGLAVLTVDAAGKATFSHRVPVSHGKVTGFIEAGDQLWMQVDATTAVQITRGTASQTSGDPILTTMPGPAPAPTTKVLAPAKAEEKEDTTQSETRPSVKIVAMYPGKVKLDVGSKDEVKAGDKFTAFRLQQVERSGEEGFEGDVLVGVLEIQAVNKSTSLARIWRGDRVSKDDTITFADKKLRPSKVYPRQLTHLGEIEAVFRPIINVGTRTGFGTLCDLSIAWWGEHYFIDLRIQPLGFGARDGDKVVTNSLLAEAGYNGRAFAVGMGLGMASVNGDMDAMLGYSTERAIDGGGGTSEPSWEQRTQHGFAISQNVRLGAKDGLSLTVSNVLIYHEDKNEDYTGFIYGGTNGKFSIPLALRVDMFLQGGGGVMGYAFGAIGIMTWVRGNGDTGSVGISASAGFASIWGMKKIERDWGTDTERVAITGPMFSLGLNFRFGPKRN